MHNQSESGHSQAHTNTGSITVDTPCENQAERKVCKLFNNLSADNADLEQQLASACKQFDNLDEPKA